MSGNKLSVFLNVYDFVPINNCLGFLGIGGYHTGIQLKGLEFCYFVCDSDSNQTGVMAIEPESAEFMFSQKLFLGEIDVAGEQLQQIIDELSAKYTCGKYHLFNNNCNHFSNEMATKLLRKGIPQWTFRLTNILKFVCCCLPVGLLSGKWALERMEKEMQKQRQIIIRKYTESTSSEKNEQNL